MTTRSKESMSRKDERSKGRANVIAEVVAPYSAKGIKKVKPNFRARLRGATVIERVRIERDGVPAEYVKALINEAALSANGFQRLTRIPKATYTKKMKDEASFTGTAGQSVIGLMDLINRVEEMMATQKHNPSAKNFDAKKWVGEWIQEAQPAIGGRAPIDIMDTPTGRESVMRLLGAMQSGAYQ